MIGELTNWIIELLRTHGALSVFVGVIVESVIIPIPSPLIIMAAGAILVPPDAAWAQAMAHIFQRVVLPGASASTIGAFFGFGIGFWGGKPVIERFEKFIGFGWSDVQRLERHWSSRNIGLSIFFLRALPIIPLSLISAAAGVLRLSVGTFTWWTFWGSLLRCFILGYLGWALSDTYYGLANRLNFFETLMSASIVAAVAVLVLWLRKRLRSF